MEFLRLLLEYEDRMKGAERKMVQSIAKPHLWAAEREMYDDIPEKRALAVRCLGVLGLPDSEKFLLDALEDSSTEVALAAAYSLAERGGARYAIPILSHLHRFERWSPRYLGEMLAFMGEEVAPDLTALCLDEGKPAKVRAISADALRLIGYPDAADIAATILHQGETAKWRGEREPRIAALRILALLGRPEHLPLIRRLAGDPDPVIREVSITALGALGTRVDLPLLIEEMGGPSPWVALEAARSIRSLQEIGEADGEIQVTPERISLFREVLGS
jgi:HEAT repeat protein